MKSYLPAILMVIGGVLLLSGGNGGGVSPGPSGDVLAICHTADRASQVKILREYAKQTFANDAAGQKWLNDQRAAARTEDWVPYTDELGKACLDGPAAVNALADKLEAAR